MLSSTATLIDVSVCSAHLLCYSGVECPLKGDGGHGSLSKGWQAVVEAVTEQQHELLPPSLSPFVLQNTYLLFYALQD